MTAKTKFIPNSLHWSFTVFSFAAVFLAKYFCRFDYKRNWEQRQFWSGHTIMSNKKSMEKANRITEIDDHIRRNFDILKVNRKVNSSRRNIRSLLRSTKTNTHTHTLERNLSRIIFCMTLIMFGCHLFALLSSFFRWYQFFCWCCYCGKNAI